MTKPLARSGHGLVADYPYVVVVGLIAPTLLGATGTPLLMFRIVAVLALVGALLTRAEWGLIRVIPYRVHLIIDLLVSLFVLVSPWLLSFADQPGPRWFAIAAGLFGFGVVALSKTDEMPTGQAVTA